MIHAPRYTLSTISFAISFLLHQGCISNNTTISRKINGDSAAYDQIEEEAPFQQSMVGYMAELGQYMDDVYRFWDSSSMQDVAIQRLDQMLIIHDECILIYKDYLLSREDEELSSEADKFEKYLQKSKALTIKLREAIESGDPDAVKEALDKLDRNRRNAHSVFG